MNAEAPTSSRSGRQLLDATKPFAAEDRNRSWRLAGSTLFLMFAALTGVAMIRWWPLRLALSVLGGLLMVRAFVIFHDYMHGAILRDSRLGRWLMYGVGLLLLTPPRAWRESHNYHHANVGKIAPHGEAAAVVTTDIGAYPMMSVAMWQRASFMERLRYRISRHPVTIFCAYFTIFMGAMCLGSTLSNPRKHWPGGLVFLVHLTLLAGLWISGGWTMAFFGYFLPLWIAAFLGSYLFYAQHSFPGARVYPPDEWNYFEAALTTASFFKLGRIMDWFTGSIGYHHVHHLNSSIPFYRLREAMEAIPELQNPVVTRMKLRDVRACFRANLWDPQKGCMVSWREARTSVPASA